MRGDAFENCTRFPNAPYFLHNDGNIRKMFNNLVEYNVIENVIWEWIKRAIQMGDNIGC